MMEVCRDGELVDEQVFLNDCHENDGENHGTLQYKAKEILRDQPHVNFYKVSLVDFGTKYLALIGLSFGIIFTNLFE